MMSDERQPDGASAWNRRPVLDGKGSQDRTVGRRADDTAEAEELFVRTGGTTPSKSTLGRLLKLVSDEWSRSTRSWSCSRSAPAPTCPLEELTVRAAQDFDAYYRDRWCEPEQTDDLLVPSFDGKGIAMRHEDRRQGECVANVQGLAPIVVFACSATAEKRNVGSVLGRPQST